jgi:LysR family transcriptional regulator, glycine cleavage system transcriptional activator
MKLSHLNGLRALESTLRKGTFTAASEELGVTVAAIGQQIRGLEEYLGVKLFDRLPSGAVPTEAARQVASQLTVGFCQIEDALGQLAAVRRAAKLRVATFKWFHEDWLTDRIPNFYDRYPQVEVEFDLGDKFVDLVRGEADIAVRLGRPGGAELKREHLFFGGFMPLCTPEFAKAHGLGESTRDLTGIPLFRYSPTSGDPAIVGWSILLERHGIRRDDPTPPNRVAGTRAALAGHGLVLCGLVSSFAELRSGRLVAPLGPQLFTQYSYPYALAWSAGRSLTPAMRTFRDWILHECETFLGQASDLLGVKLN